MSRDTTATLAKASWIVPVVYVFANRFVGMVIGRVLADMLVPVLAFATIILAAWCLVLTRRHGTRGILGHAIAGILVGVLLLAIWIPNFLNARERARATTVSSSPFSLRVTSS